MERPTVWAAWKQCAQAVFMHSPVQRNMPLRRRTGSAASREDAVKAGHGERGAGEMLFHAQ